jgi:secernin
MCDTLAILRDGRTLFAKNSDREHVEAQLLEYVPAGVHPAGSVATLTYASIEQARETNAVLISRPFWIWGAEIGANSHGLTIGNEAIFTTVPASTAPGIVGMDYVRLALERARSAEEGVDVIVSLLKEHGQGGNCSPTGDVGYYNSYLLADIDGALVLETVDRDWETRRISGHSAISNAITCRGDDAGAAIGTNAQGNKGRDFRTLYHDRNMEASPDFRHGRLMDLMASVGEGTQTDLFAILRDHAPGPTLPDRAAPRICAHAEKASLGQTTGSWVADLRAETCLHWVTGTASPCTSLFKPMLVGMDVPHYGPAPSRERDAQSLWWRHERLRKTLIAADDTYRRGFETARDALEQSFVAAVDDAVALGSPVELRCAIDQCWAQAQVFENEWIARCGPEFG